MVERLGSSEYVGLFSRFSLADLNMDSFTDLTLVLPVVPDMDGSYIDNLQEYMLCVQKKQTGNDLVIFNYLVF